MAVDTAAIDASRPSPVDGPPPARGPVRFPVDIDSGVAHTARVYDYLLGGADNFAVDREVAEHAFAAYPGGVEGARTDARANRAFLGRVVRYLVGEAGIRQFLDIGTGIPTAGNVHQVAQGLAPDTRVVYVDNDPIVLAHAHALLLESSEEGATDYIDGDLRAPEPILRRAADTLDFGVPVALMLNGILHVIPDEDGPHDIVATLVDALPSGSYLAISHIVTDVQPDSMATVAERLGATMRTTNPPALRSRADVCRFFDGLDLVEPGVVEVNRWRPDDDAPPPAGGRPLPLHGGVARKP